MAVTIVGTQAAVFAAAFGIFLSLVLAIMIKQNDVIVDTLHTPTG
jgi:hypothetical protein